jgi:hypothetical protein
LRLSWVGGTKAKGMLAAGLGQSELSTSWLKELIVKAEC